MGHSASSARHAHEQALYMEANSEADAQTQMADRACYRTFAGKFCHWSENVYGGDDGLTGCKGKLTSILQKTMLMEEKPFLQWYEAPVSERDNELEEKAPPAKQEPSEKPLVLAICTPLLARAHRNVVQAGEIVFYDSSSSMDRFNTSLFIISTTTACSGIPLAVVMTSDETEGTVKWR